MERSIKFNDKYHDSEKKIFHSLPNESCVGFNGNLPAPNFFDQTHLFIVYQRKYRFDVNIETVWLVTQKIHTFVDTVKRNKKKLFNLHRKIPSYMWFMAYCLQKDKISTICESYS